MPSKEEMRMTLFGPNPAEVSEARADQTQANGFNWASLPAGRGGVAAAAMAGTNLGRGIGEATGIYQDPAMQKARLMEEAKMEVDSSGVSLLTDPNAYYEAAYNALQKRGLQDEAMNVRNLMRAESMQQQELDISKQNARSDAIKADAAYIKALNDGSIDPTKNVDVLIGPEGDLRQAQQGTEEYQGLLDGGYKPYKEPSDVKTLAQAMISGNQALTGLAQSMADAAGAEAESKARGQANVKQESEIYARASLSRNVRRQLSAVKAGIEDGQSQFGSLAEVRRNIAGAFETFLPQVSDEVNQVLGVDLVSFDTVDRASKTILAELASFYGSDGRMTKAALDTLKDAGPSLFLTNAGLQAVTELMEKDANWYEDKAAFVASLPPNTNIGAATNQWEAEHINDERYNMSPEDFKRLRALQAKNTKLKDIMKRAQPMPLARDRETGVVVAHPSVRNSSAGSIFSYEGKFYEFDGQKLLEVKI